LENIYCKQNGHNQVFQYLKKAGKFQEKLLPSDPLILVKTYQRIAVTCVNKNDYDLAIQFYDRTLQIRKDNLPPYDKNIPVNKRNLLRH
jgi:tetratricopeptide (TPR) repeat protein